MRDQDQLLISQQTFVISLIGCLRHVDTNRADEDVAQIVFICNSLAETTPRLIASLRRKTSLSAPEQIPRKDYRLSLATPETRCPLSSSMHGLIPNQTAARSGPSRCYPAVLKLHFKSSSRLKVAYPEMRVYLPLWLPLHCAALNDLLSCVKVNMDKSYRGSFA